MNLGKVKAAHKSLIFQNKEDPELIEKSERVPFCHSLGEDGMVLPHHNYHGGRWVDRLNNTTMFPAHSSDLFVCCFPRSGSNWCQNMIKHIKELPLETITINLVKWFEGHTNDQLAAFPPPRIFKSHLHMGKLPKGVRTIYIARNPFDNCVATYEILRGYCTFGAEELPFEKYLEMYLGGDVLFGSWFDHVTQGFKHALENPDNTLFLRYEDMKADEAGTVLKIADFIGETTSRDRATEIASLTTFNKMKKDPTANFEWTKLLCNEGFDFIRKGLVGDYLNYFNEKQINTMKEKLKEISSDGVNCFDDYL